MTHQKPLVTWKRIAAALDVSEKTAQKICKECNVPLMYFGSRVAVWPKDLEEITKHEISQEKSGIIYFIQAEDRGIKIGWTSNLKHRFAGLKNTIPMDLKILGYIDGTVKDEEKLHKRFDKYRFKGEWFEISIAILRYISRYTNND